MKILTWDSGYTYDDPNIFWGDPSYILEPGDPNYTPPPNPTPKPGKRTMKNNPIARNNKVVLAQGEDVADGMTAIQDDVNLKQTRDTDLRPILAQLKGDHGPLIPVGTPAYLGLIFIYDDRKAQTGDAYEARKAKDEEVKQFLTDARDVLKKPALLGPAWSPAWVTAGFTESGSTAVPASQDDRFASIFAIANYFAQNPTHESPGPAPHPVITAARAQLLHTELSNARALVNDCTNKQEAAKLARDAVFEILRKRLIATVDELGLLLSDTDPRWEAFGLNIPANPRAPEPATDLILSGAGVKRVLSQWTRGSRSDDNRIMVQVVGVDLEYRELDKSGEATEYVIKDMPSGATLKVKIIALNGSLEAVTGPEAQIVVP